VKLIQHPSRSASSDLFDAERRARGQAVEAAGWDSLAFTEHPAAGYRWLRRVAAGARPVRGARRRGAVTEQIKLLTYRSVPYGTRCSWR
jgi:hypothetical protein